MWQPAVSLAKAQERRAQVVAQQIPGATQPRYRSRSPLGLTQNILHLESAGGGGAGLFLHAQIYFWPTATKTATCPK